MAFVNGRYEIMCPPFEKVVVPLSLWKRGIKGDLKSLSFSLYERERYILRQAQNERRGDSE
jgi:hypothetical protein